MVKEYQYPGEELTLFEEAKNWKKYLSQQIIPYIKGNVLEVGAGISETTSFLLNNQVTKWTCLEPDKQLAGIIQDKINRQQLPSMCVAINGSINDLALNQKYDTVIYIDVLEHIKDDKTEITYACAHLTKGGNLIVLSPAFQVFYNRFDQAVGHYRRYTKKSLRSTIGTNDLNEVKLIYIESTGLTLLLLNKIFFRRKYPSLLAIKLWDKLFIPVSRIIDKMIFHSIGKSIIGIWTYSKP